MICDAVFVTSGSTLRQRPAVEVGLGAHVSKSLGLAGLGRTMWCGRMPGDVQLGDQDR